MARILIVEDDASIAELEQVYLNYGGYLVDWVQNATDAFAKIKECVYDAVVLDVMLPGQTDGFAICQRIREKQNIPIIMVSAKTDEMDKIKGLGYGADDYITKPFSPGELVARVKAHISRHERLTGKTAASNGDWIHVRGVSLERESRRVFIDEIDIALSLKEFDLLALFMTHPNKVFTKEHLFERVWGMDSSGDVATVTVHVRRLREKIEENPSKPTLLETVWGVGYRLRG